jgi:hypothetical protein
MGATTPDNFPWPEDGDIADVPQDMQELAEAIQAKVSTLLSRSVADNDYQTKVGYGTLANRPASGNEGDIYLVIG